MLPKFLHAAILEAAGGATTAQPRSQSSRPSYFARNTSSGFAAKITSEITDFRSEFTRLRMVVSELQAQLSFAHTAIEKLVTLESARAEPFDADSVHLDDPTHASMGFVTTDALPNIAAVLPAGFLGEDTSGALFDAAPLTTQATRKPTPPSMAKAPEIVVQFGPVEPGGPLSSVACEAGGCKGAAATLGDEAANRTNRRAGRHQRGAQP